MDNNRANQLNPNNWRFWSSRGFSGRPDDWAGKTNAVASTIQWLDILPPAITACAVVAKTCIHGLVKTVCCLCTLKGAVLTVGVISVAALYWKCTKQPEEVAPAPKSWTTGSVTNYVKEQGSKVWSYGAKESKPVETSGLSKITSNIGYYFGASGKK